MESTQMTHIYRMSRFLPEKHDPNEQD